MAICHYRDEKKDYGDEMRLGYASGLDYLVGLSTYAILPNMKTSR